MGIRLTDTVPLVDDVLGSEVDVVTDDVSVTVGTLDSVEG